ncbi:hypothetical protein LMG23994_00772 [Cupriavidus pinatubonensis]|uniref:Phage Gp37Gp68 n=2 Tax=Cupriavidus pinatubonensis TaxID=248026 RepID=A0ABN7Y193_9BURK|nr:hypothetical protein LMG23994_00772 [Cupriavidus pinatubonensis]
MDTRLHQVQWGPGAERRRTSVANWRKPLQWNKAHAEFFAQHGRRQRVFCASLADVFDKAVEPGWRLDLLQLIADTPQLDWLLLTKRIGNAHAMLDSALAELSHGLTRWACVPWPNVWLRATICNQTEADRDIPKLLATPAAVRFLSLEPLLGPVTIRQHLMAGDHPGLCAACGKGHGFTRCPNYGRVATTRENCNGFVRADFAIGWVIVGGESGASARPMHPDWARSLRDQCAAAGVPFLFKQWGEWAPGEASGAISSTQATDQDADIPCAMRRVGEKAAGRLLDGVEHDVFPSTTGKVDGGAA